MYTHLSSSELFPHLFGAIGDPKKNSRKKVPFLRVAKNNYNFAPNAANHTFFTHPVELKYIGEIAKIF